MEMPIQAALSSLTGVEMNMEMTQELEVPNREIVDDAHNLCIMFDNLPIEIKILLLKAAECSTAEEYKSKVRDLKWRAHF